MPIRVLRFFLLILAALSLGIAIGQLAQLPERLAWDQDLWVGATAQGGFFSLSGPLGAILQVLTFIGLIVLAVLSRRRGGVGLPYIVAAVCFAFGLLFWWVLVYPVNVELAKWVNGPVPANWQEWRALWEWGQAANGIAQLLGFAALAASTLGPSRSSA